MIDLSTRGYSADVRLLLVVGERLVPIAKLGPHRCVLREPTELPRGPAEIVVRIDHDEQRWPVFLPQGASGNNPHVKLEAE